VQVQAAGHASRTVTRYWPVSVAGVIVAMMAIQMSSLGFSPLLPAIRTDLSASYSQMGLFTGMYGLIAIAMSVPAGLLATRFGEKRVLLAGLVTTAVGLVVLGNARSYLVALAARAVWLVGYRAAFICVFTALAIATPERHRGRTTGILGAMAALASVLGAPFGTTLASSLGWRVGIFGFAAIAVAGGVLFALLYGPNREMGRRTSTSRLPDVVHSSKPSSLRGFAPWGIVLLGLINMGGFSATFFAPYAVESVFGLNPRASAGIISAAYVVAIFLNLGFGYLCDRYSRWNTMIAIACLLIPCSFAVMSHNLAVFQTSVVLLISLGHVAANQTYALASYVLGKGAMGKGIGIAGLGSGIFGFIGPQTLGYLRDATGGFSAGWIFVAGAASVALIDLIVLRMYSSGGSHSGAAR
jgi:predicted MFS family arabinose efflux permease